MSDWKDILGSVAPSIAGFLGGPIAGTATQKVLEVLGLAPEASENELSSALAMATPEQLKALKLADMQFKKDMAELGIKQDAQVLQDKQDARAMRSKGDDYTADILAGTVVLAWLVCNYLMLTVGIPEGLPEPVLYRILGTLDGALILVLSFFFGASRKQEPKEAK